MTPENKKGTFRRHWPEVSKQSKTDLELKRSHFATNEDRLQMNFKFINAPSFIYQMREITITNEQKYHHERIKNKQIKKQTTFPFVLFLKHVTYALFDKSKN